MRISCLQSTVAETKKGNPYLKNDNGKKVGTFIGVCAAINANRHIRGYMSKMGGSELASYIKPVSMDLPKFKQYLEDPLYNIAKLRKCLELKNAPKLTQAAVHLGTAAAVVGAVVGTWYLIGAAADKISNKIRAHSADKLAKKMEAEKMNEE